MKLSRILLLGLLTVYTGLVLAAEKGKPEPGGEVTPQPRTSLVTEAPTPISSRRAAVLVKERFEGARVLGVSRLEPGGAPLYKVRTLSQDGVVRSVFVDSKTGEIFQ